MISSSSCFSDQDEYKTSPLIPKSLSSHENEGTILVSEGFSHLLIQEVNEQVLLQAMQEDPTGNFIYINDLNIPIERVTIQSTNQHDYKMVASRDYKKNETIFKNRSMIISELSNIVVQMNGMRLWLENLVHTVARGNGEREFYGFDSFQNHSCDPNSIMVYQSKQDYELVACKDIQSGEEITSDYESFDSQLDGTVFTCLCGSSNCRGIIKG